MSECNDEYPVEVGEVLSVIHRVEALEQEVRSLRHLYGADRGQPMFVLGETYFPHGDAIPTHGSPIDNFEGRVYAFSGKPARLTKNTSGSEIKPGASYKHMNGDVCVAEGKVDGKLCRAVSPNNFFWLEL